MKQPIMLTIILFTVQFLAAVWGQTEQKPELVVQTGNDRSISVMAFSPDSQFVATADFAGTIILWDINGNQLRKFNESVSDISFTSDNQIIALANSKVVSIRNISSKKEINRFELDSFKINSAAISPNGKFLLVGANNGNNRKTEILNKCFLWDTEQNKTIQTFDNCLTGNFSPDNQKIVISLETTDESGKEILQVWGVLDEQKKWKTFSNRDFSNTSQLLLFSADGKQIISGDKYYSGCFFLFEAETGTSNDKELCLGYEDEEYEEKVESSGPRYVISPNLKYLLLYDGFEHNTQGLYRSSTKLLNFSSGKQIHLLSRKARIPQIIQTTDANSNQLMIGDLLGDAYLWSLTEGKEIRRFIQPKDEGEENLTEDEELTGQNSLPVASISRNGQYIFTAPDGGFASNIFRWDAATGNLLNRLDGEVLSVNASNNKNRVFIQTCGSLSLVNPVNNKIIWVAETDSASCQGFAQLREMRKTTKLSADETVILVGQFRENEAALLDARTGKVKRIFPKAEGYPVAISPNNRFAVTVHFEYLEKEKKSKVFTLIIDTLTKQTKKLPFGAYSLVFSPNGQHLLLLAGKSLIKVDPKTGKESGRIEIDESIAHDIAFSPDGKFILVSFDDGSVRFFDVNEFKVKKEICRIFSLRDGNWIVIRDDGRFDTSSLENIKGLLWTISDEPLRPLPLEVFMRDYYEPNLLSRLLKCNKVGSCDKEFTPLPNLSELNRVQPEVKFTNVSVPTRANQVKVSVEVNRGAVPATECQMKRCQSDVFDLRLFRDGQLVGAYPKTGQAKLIQQRDYEVADIAQRKELWRKATKVDLDAKTGKRQLIFEVQLPKNKPTAEVEFTAYAFNEDRVKSQTAQWHWPEDVKAKLPPAAPVKPKAYLVAVGVNASQNSGWNLRYAANDARATQQLLANRIAALGAYSDVVSVPLISDYDANGQLAVNDATKGKIEAVLATLAGKTLTPEQQQLIADIKTHTPDAARLAKVTPDDMVVLFFSSHGYADNLGNFFLLPYDVGAKVPGQKLSAVLPRAISSDELSLWLRDVDGGEMVMIVDACHSTPDVANTDFKPGPMSSRGLGQLAYEKRMRILTATQADNVALESNKLQQGYLSYALLQEGLNTGQADFKAADGTIFLDEWLQFGVERVPKLYQDIRDKKLSGVVQSVNVRKDVVEEGAAAVAPDTQLQQPYLFDFTTRRQKFVLARKP